MLENNLNERTISHKLAKYLSKEFCDWYVDTEYNRNNDKVKTLQYENIKSDDTDTHTVYPDIIIYRRNTDDNLLVIEVKKNSKEEEKTQDLKKIQRFIKELHYKYGLFIDFNIEKNTILMN